MADASTDVEAVAGATSGGLMLVILAVVVVGLVAKRRKDLETDRKIVEWEREHRPAIQTNPVYAAAGRTYQVPLEHAGGRDAPGHTIAVDSQGTCEIADRSGRIYLVPAEPLCAESDTDTACRTADLVYAVPLDEAGSDASGSVYVSAKPHDSGGYQTLTPNGAYGTRLPTGSDLPYNTLALSNTYAIPTETGSNTVVYATTDGRAIAQHRHAIQTNPVYAADSDPHGEYLEVDGAGRADDAYATPREGVQAPGLAADQGVPPANESATLPAGGGYPALGVDGVHGANAPGTRWSVGSSSPSSIYAIPTETGSVVLYGTADDRPISPESYPHGEYLEVDGAGRADDAYATPREGVQAPGSVVLYGTADEGAISPD